MSVVTPVEGAVLQRILNTEAAESTGLRGEAFARFDAAVGAVPWVARHQRRRALMAGVELLASAQQYNLTGVLDKHPVRICGIGQVVADPLHRDGNYAQVLIERLVEQAARDGVEMVLLFSPPEAPVAANGFTILPLLDVELTVAESSRHGAPMTLIRGGEDRDLAAIVAMGQARGHRCRFHVDRDGELVKYAITRKRLRAGLGAAGARQLRFVIAEEGITAAAYVVISVCEGTWTIEECGDRDPSGARVGAILQGLIACEPAERRPIIRAWLPPGFLPPQVTIVSTRPAAPVVQTRFLNAAQGSRPLASADVLYWHSDLLS